MPIKQYKPTTPSLRHMAVADFVEITTSKPEKSLLGTVKRTGGRNNQGKITCRHRGGGTKRRYRMIDFMRNKLDMAATVLSVEYDPNRSARIALIEFEDGEKRYIISPLGLKVDDKVYNSDEADIRPGNSLPIRCIPVGTVIHCIELQPNRGAQLVRGAGVSAQLVAKEGSYSQIRLPSGEVRMVHVNCRASIGQVGHIEHENESLGKAGKTRYLGRRPHVRGSAMNPCDHPHGGGEGKAPVGRKGGPVTPWGKPALGKKTRNNKSTDKFIVRRRNKK